MEIVRPKIAQCGVALSAALMLCLGVNPLAAAQDGSAEAEGTAAPISAECVAFAKDDGADLGEVLKAGCEPTLAQMSALMDNPLGNVAMWFNQYDQYFLENDANGKSALQGNYMGILQFPKGLGKNWNLINRIVYNVSSVPLDQDKIDAAGLDAPTCTPPPGGGPPVCTEPPGAPIDLFSGRTTGLGDTYYVGLFSPKTPTEMLNGKFVWGAGFDVMIPTATEDVLGTGKWAAGPSALGVYLGPKWKLGALAQHYVDFAGSDNKGDVNLTNLQYFYMYGLNPTTSIGAAPNIIVNWEESGTSRFTIPIGLGINKTVQFGKIPVRFGFEVYYSVWRPNNVPAVDWNLRFYAIPAAPSALFGWMQ
ncbi:MAG: hypothetical protein ACR2QV_08925 [Gammaproteobacteria bacterium]